MKSETTCINPYLISFPKIGGSDRGYLSLAEGKDLPFKPQRVYWTYFTPENVERGGHAHYKLNQILIAVSGKITVTIETLKESFVFVLDSPSIGLFIPELCWRSLKYTHNAVQVCLASIEYSPDDYIRTYNDFKTLKNVV